MADEEQEACAVGLLERIDAPADVRALSLEQCGGLATEIRRFLVDKVSRTGGHLGPNLGVVELTIALHRVFDSPADVLLWDTGHQAYVHKLLTGRRAGFDHLRQQDGLSGYPSRTESPHDVIENSHASTALSYADGIAKALERTGELGRRHVVAVVGDGSLTGGMAWEALNNIADSSRQVIVVVNDNERSYSQTIGGLARHLDTLRTTGGYERFLEWGKGVLGRTPVVGAPVFEALHGVKKGIKDIVAPQGLFEDLGIKYLGPVDGHDVEALETVLRAARGYEGPVIVHAITQKGRGYAPAENDEADRFHGVGVIDPETGVPISNGGPTWTGVFADELVALGHERDDVVAITAAMLGPTGLDRFAAAFPERTYDVGIAEQHAATSAAGMAYAGLHPVVAVYATFLNRAFDQVLMDVALHRAGVTFVLDRAGVTGDDGASHNGMWDCSMLAMVPGVRIAAPRDEATLRTALREAVAVDDAPTVVRFPKGRLAEPLPATSSRDGVDLLHVDPDPQVLLVGFGSMAGAAREAAAKLSADGVPCVAAAPVWVVPTSPGLVALAGEVGAVVTLEDNGVVGGLGATLAVACADAGLVVRSTRLGIPQAFLAHASRPALLDQLGLTAQGCAEAARALLDRS
ncbi:MAG: 1-deoxy-D-xylulose-5-phosphate synthase [Candidatus Nanopelagicales bacterium]|nr:1-deoxy-D-xylulose-5-phosphate synthase [Candidatus Nanopelagicales bacterium]